MARISELGKGKVIIDIHDDNQIREVAIENLGIAYRIEPVGI